MEPRISLITLGVKDVRRSRAFYEDLGWVSPSPPAGDIAFFQAGSMVLALWGRRDLAEDTGVVDGGGWGGVTLAHNVGSPEEVDVLVDRATAAGAAVARAPGPTFWGGYSGVIVDPDGHAWEIAHNPHWTLGPDGAVRLPQ